LRLTKGWKIAIIGLIIASAGLSFWGVNAFLQTWSSRNNFFFATVYFVGMLVLYYSMRIRRRERKNLDNKQKT
jgi:hypothetical protein